MKNRNTKLWQDILMHDATGVDTADPMLVDYLLAKIGAPLREALLRRYQGQQYPHRRDQQSQDSNDEGQRQNSDKYQPPHSSAKERSLVISGLRAIRAVIVKDTISVSEAHNKRTEEWKGINEKILQNAGLSWEEYQRMAEVVHAPAPTESRKEG